MKTKFTEGNWFSDGYFCSDGERLEIRGNNNALVCDKIANEHDAHLIASAPKLYAMLDEVLYNFKVGNSDNFEINDSMINGIDSLLAEARGE